MTDTNGVVDLRPSSPSVVVRHTPAPTDSPQIPKRVEWVPLPPEYPGFKIKLWRNYPQMLWKDVISDMPAASDLTEIEDEGVIQLALDQQKAEVDAVIEHRMAALSAIFVEHNHWRDFDGAEYPPANTRAFWDAIPQELAVILLAMADRTTYDLPNSLRLTRRR